MTHLIPTDPKTLFPALIFLLASSPALAAFDDWDPREQEVFSLVNLQRGFHGLNALAADDRLQSAALGHSQDMSDLGFFSHTTLLGPGSGNSAADRVFSAGYNWNTVGENIAAGQGYSFIFNGSGFDAVEDSVTDAAREVMYGTSTLQELSDFDIDTLSGSGFADWDLVGSNWSDADWGAWGSFRSGLDPAQGTGWMGSNGHRGNILSAAFFDIGIGYLFDANDTAPIQTDSGTFANPLHTYWTQNFAAGDSAVVPLPAAAWLFASALGVVAGVARRKAA